MSSVAVSSASVSVAVIMSPRPTMLAFDSGGGVRGSRGGCVISTTMSLVLFVCGVTLEFVFELLCLCSGLGFGLLRLLLGLVSWSMPVAVEGLVVRQAEECQSVASVLRSSGCIT